MKNDPLQLVARTPEQLGHALMRHRTRQELSQADLGRKAALRQPTISDLESGKGRIKTLTDALSALGLELVVRPKPGADDLDLEDMI